VFLKALQYAGVELKISRMTHLKIGLIVALLSCFATLAACSGSAGNSSNGQPAGPGLSNTNSNNDPAKTNVEVLSLQISVPYESEDVVWKEDPSHRKLMAVFLFAPEQAARVIADAEKVKPPEGVTLGSESWFPPELIAQSEMTGDDTLKARAYAANAFFGGPFNDGRIARIQGTDYFVLELFSK
jgi:hypothetical protein